MKLPESLPQREHDDGSTNNVGIPETTDGINKLFQVKNREEFITYVVLPYIKKNFGGNKDMAGKNKNYLLDTSSIEVYCNAINILSIANLQAPYTEIEFEDQKLKTSYEKLLEFRKQQLEESNEEE